MAILLEFWPGGGSGELLGWLLRSLGRDREPTEGGNRVHIGTSTGILHIHLGNGLYYGDSPRILARKGSRGHFRMNPVHRLKGLYCVKLNKHDLEDRDPQ